MSIIIDYDIIVERRLGIDGDVEEEEDEDENGGWQLLINR